MTARKLLLAATTLLATVCLAPSTAKAWGPQGHVIVAQIAELNLSDKAKQELAKLLPDTTYSDSSSISDTKLASFADFVRGNSQYPQYKDSAPWHFVDIPVDLKTAFDPAIHCKDDQCNLGKIDEFKTVFASKSMPKVRRQEALVFLVHLVGDLHQPLHCATRDDRGGNGLSVTYLGKTGHHLNLHSVWDDNLVHEAMTSPDPLKTAAKFNDDISGDNKKEWQKGATKDWMLESYELARTKSYMQGDSDTPLPKTGVPDLDDAYVKKGKQIVTLQLKKGGIRLAKILNDALDPPAP
jgi:hypothetical protein